MIVPEEKLIKFVKRANMWVVSWREWEKDRWFTIQKWFNTKKEAEVFADSNKENNSK